MHGARQGLRRLGGGNANGFAGTDVDEGGGHLAPVAELEGALAEAAAGDDADGVGGAAVDFDEGDEAFAVVAARVVDASLASPSMAMRTPSTCPAQRWPWATAASSRYSGRDFTVARFLISGQPWFQNGN